MLRTLVCLTSCRIAIAVIVSGFFIAPLPALAQSSGSAKISGSLIDQNGGLPVFGAKVDLYAGSGSVVATITPDQQGSFAFGSEPPGSYYVVVRASGYVSARSNDIIAAAGTTSRIPFALQRSQSTDERQVIGRTSNNSVGAKALQTSSVVTASLDPQLLASQGQILATASLGRLPGVSSSAQSSRGNDALLRIRGSKVSEVAVLLDGHPIGPRGAQADPGGTDPWEAGFNFMASPLFALSNIQVAYGSDALGLFGTGSLAGSVDFQTLNPTRDRPSVIRQGFGNQGQSLTVMQTSGTAGKLGYVLLHGVEGLLVNSPREKSSIAAASAKTSPRPTLRM